MASPIVLWHFRRAISISSSAIVASWIKTVELKPALLRLGVGWVSPENLKERKKENFENLITGKQKG